MTSSVSPEQACVQWQNMIDLFESAVQCTTFDAGRLGSFSPEKLLAVYHYEKAHGGLSAAAARANVPPDILQALVQSLRSVLDGFIEPESDRLGYGLVNLMGGLPQPKVTDFARILVRAAATLGAHRVVKLLFEWANGGRLRYRTRALLAGVSVGNRIALEDGLEITRLPTSGNKLHAQVPVFSMQMHGYESFLGGVVMSVDCEAGPALYLPPKCGSLRSNVEHIWAQGRLPNLSLDTFCDALSLASNRCVRCKAHWRDFGELQELNLAVGTGVSYAEVPTWGSKGELSQEHLEQARDVHLQRQRTRKSGGKLDITIRRWVNSRRPETNLVDKFIDLRIALEALYLERLEGEMGFRLATYGAWHLGRSLAERREYRAVLRKAYQVSSKAVHSGELSNTERTRDLLAEAQDLCRRGILRRLREKQKPKWENIILGGTSDAS